MELIKPIIISNNCWGAEAYKFLKVQYYSPFIGLYIRAPDYINLLENLYHTITSKVHFDTYFDSEEKKSYPIGIMKGDIVLHCVHSHNKEDALEKWERRCERMLNVWSNDNIFIKICDRDNFNYDYLCRFYELKFSKKISFGVKEYPHKSHYVINNTKEPWCPDGPTLFKISSEIIDFEKFFSSCH